MKNKQNKIGNSRLGLVIPRDSLSNSHSTLPITNPFRAKLNVRPKRSQQEIVGFVLIVVLVVVALMVFLIISLREPSEMKQSVEVENLLNALMKHTTGCAIVYEPDYDNMEDLIKSCYDNQMCSNLNKMACDYMNETLKSIMDDLLETESQISAYQLEIIHEDSGGGSENLLNLFKGNCKGGAVDSEGGGVVEQKAGGGVAGAQEIISVGNGKIIVRLRFCY